MNIYLVRHAQSMGNLTGDYSTNLHDTLSPNGNLQAVDLSKRLKDLEFEFIYSSPLRRALDTIKPFLKEHNYQSEIWPELAETCWQDDRTIKENDPPQYVEFDNLTDEDKNLFKFRDNQTLHPTGEETYSQGIHRLKESLKLLKMKNKPGDNVLIVSHAFSISRLIELLINKSPDGIFDFDNTGLSLLSLEDGEFKIKYVNRL